MSPDLVVQTQSASVDACTQQIIDYLITARQFESKRKLFDGLQDSGPSARSIAARL